MYFDCFITDDYLLPEGSRDLVNTSGRSGDTSKVALVKVTYGSTSYEVPDPRKTRIVGCGHLIMGTAL